MLTARMAILGAGASALASAGLTLLACGPQTTRFAGTERDRIARADQILDYGVDRPDGSELVGVVSTRCETTNGASGLLADDCDEPTLRAQLRQRAAEVGGTGLVELTCRHADLDRQIEQVDGGSVTHTVHAALTCQATVVRGKLGARPPTASDAGANRVSVRGAQVEIWVEAGSDEDVATPSDAVGELDAFPEGYASLGTGVARCIDGCARSTARQALLILAGKRGADAIAETACELAGEAWSCRAKLVGAAIDAGLPP